MIYGIGTDTVMIERIRAAQERTGGRLAERVLGPQELEKFHARSRRHAGRGIAFLATRFATKEAVSKAIGLGMRWPMSWRSVQTLNDPSGKPVVAVSGELSAWLAERRLRLHVSVSDERDVAAAFAVAEIMNDDAAAAVAAATVTAAIIEAQQADSSASGAP